LLDEVLTTKPDDAGLLTGSLSAADVKAVLDSAGVEADDGRVDDLLEELKGGNIDELVDEASNTVWLHR
jgi:ribosomal protein L12E/L44/L45/RPP1/RPP2